MAQRLRILLSAYACEPGKGSEPEVGWQWALQMARFHDVTVLTRVNNRPGIERALRELQGAQPLPEFVYHDRGPLLLQFKKRTGMVQLYYLLWQKSAWEIIDRLHQARPFDLIHHVTFAAFRYPTAIWGHGVPTIWGPIGGIESIPTRLLPWKHIFSLGHEIARNVSNLVQRAPYYVLPRRAAATTLILVSTREMQAMFASLGIAARLMPTIGLRTRELPAPAARTFNTGKPLKLLFVGNLITLKGLDLALEAFKRSQIDGTFTFIGSGNYEKAARRLAGRLGVGDRAVFKGRLPREEVFREYEHFDVFIFPSLHDTGGYAVIEAMLNGLPVICLDCGGPPVAVRDGCGVKVPVTSRREIIGQIAAAIRGYDQDRARLKAEGTAARTSVLEHYDWDQKGREMAECYAEAIKLDREHSGSARTLRAQMGSLTNLIARALSFRGLMVSLAGLLLIGTSGFVGIGHLKNQASAIVADTLPGLAYAGEINANSAQAFSRILLFIASTNRQEQAELQKQSDYFIDSTTAFIEAYRKQAASDEDRVLFAALLEQRRQYLASREKIMSLAASGQIEEAERFCRGELLPIYSQYKIAGDKLFEYNIKQGRARGREIMFVCTLTQILVALAGVMIFVLGFLIGVSR